MSSEEPSAIEILSLLQAYSDAHQDATSELHASMWNLTKARHSKRNATAALVSSVTEMTASSVRQELVQAQTVLLVSTKETNNNVAVPTLVGENAVDSSGDEPPVGQNEWMFRLADREEAEKKQSKIPAQKIDGLKSRIGLRQRKGSYHAGASNEAPEWLVDDNNTTGTESKVGHDPLILLGGSLPPMELRVAQEKAKTAIAAYCKAANMVAAIQMALLYIKK
jgi:hypothetical protein